MENTLRRFQVKLKLGDPEEYNVHNIALAKAFRAKGADEDWIQRYIYGKWDLEK